MMSSSTSIPSPAIEGGSLPLIKSTCCDDGLRHGNAVDVPGQPQLQRQNNDGGVNILPKNDNIKNNATCNNNNYLSTSSSPAMKDPYSSHTTANYNNNYNNQGALGTGKLGHLFHTQNDYGVNNSFQYHKPIKALEQLSEESAANTVDETYQRQVVPSSPPPCPCEINCFNGINSEKKEILAQDYLCILVNNDGVALTESAIGFRHTGADFSQQSLAWKVSIKSFILFFCINDPM